jgi:hypothetical protein
MADFFTKLEQKYGNGGPQLLSDHPNPGNREAAIQKEIQPWPGKNYTSNTGQFASAKKTATGLKAYSAQEIDAGAKQGTWAQQNQKNGAVPPRGAAAQPSGGGQGNTQPQGQGGGDISNVSYKQVQPSSNFRQFQQGGMTISYPDNWQTGGDQNSSMIVPPAGAGNGGIAYGVIIGTQQTGGGNLDQTTQALVQGMQRDNPGLQPAGEMSNIDVNGVQGRSMYLRGNSPVQQNGQPAPERDWLVTLPNPQGGVTYLVFIAPEHDFNKLQPTYQKMLQSLRMS